MRKPMFTFKMNVVEKDPRAYYYPHTDKSILLSVIASNRDEAYKVAEEMLGEALEGCYWRINIKSIVQTIAED